MTLQDYLSREGFTFTAFAAMIGTDYPSTVERYAKGRQIPGRRMMEEIVRVTKGDVMPNDFYGFHAHEAIAARAEPSPHSETKIIGEAA